MSATSERLTTNLFLVDDLEDASRTSELSEGDLDALRAVADWIKTFMARPHKDLGRPGPVCPFVGGAMEHHALWLAPEHITDRSVPEVVEVVRGYQRAVQGQQAQTTDGGEAIYKGFVVVFTDLSADRAMEPLGELVEQLAVPSYVKDGFTMGPFYDGNEATAIYNAHFRPFTLPVPSLLVRQAVVSDWKFFLDNDEWLGRWARRNGDSAAHELAEELRRLPWRERPGRSREGQMPSDTQQPPDPAERRVGTFAEGEETLPMDNRVGTFAEGEETLPMDNRVGTFADGQDAQP